MRFSRFNLRAVLQILILSLSVWAFFWTLDQEYVSVTKWFLFTAILFQIFMLLFLFSRTNREIARFLNSIIKVDSKMAYDLPTPGKIDSKLYESMVRIVEVINQLKLEKERDLQFYSQAIEQINTAILAFDEKGKIYLANRALLNMFELDHIERLNTLSSIKADLPQQLLNMKPGHSQVIDIQTNNFNLQLLAHVSDLISDGNQFRLIGLNDIKTALDKKETESWQRLIQVINHEIINSLVPVNLLSSGLIMDLKDEQSDIEALSPELYQNLTTGLSTIRNRSQNLTNFVESYRQAMHVRQPQYQKVQVSEILGGISDLFREELKIKKISQQTYIDPSDLIMYCDPELVEQILINVIRNSIQALDKTENPHIRIEGSKSNDQVDIKIFDNGCGIAEENLSIIFAPTFSSKEKGLGIGLSMARRIMNLHKGRIQVHSYPGKETVFTLSFPILPGYTKEGLRA